MLRVESTLFLLLSLGLPSMVIAQTASPSQTSTPNASSNATQDTQSTPSNQDPLKRPLSDKEKFKQQKELRNELKGPYKKWVDEDVRWIITDQELKAFKSLSNDEERDNFIEQFWRRRNPDPDSPENEYRDENYRRIAYANEHFAAGKPGWKTDRGHMYIAYGKPDSIESHPSGGSYERPMEEGGGETSTFPFETWHYRYIEGIGENIDIEFVDTCMCGDYHMTLDRSEKDALLHVPGAGATLGEQMGTSKRTDRFNGGLETWAPHLLDAAGCNLDGPGRRGRHRADQCDRQYRRFCRAVRPRLDQGNDGQLLRTLGRWRGRPPDGTHHARGRPRCRGGTWRRDDAAAGGRRRSRSNTVGLELNVQSIGINSWFRQREGEYLHGFRSD